MADMRSYRRYMKRFPTPGGGGAHRGFFAAGCLGARAGLPEEQVVADVRAYLPQGTRPVGAREIEEGVHAGYSNIVQGGPTRTKAPVRIAPGTLERFVGAGRGATAEDLAAMSPVKIEWPEDEHWRALDLLFDESERVFVGDDRTPGVVGESIRPVCDWIEVFELEGAVEGPKLIVNPVTGEAAPKRSGNGVTYRGDGCVAAFRYAVAESDSLSFEQQVAFWAGWGCRNLPVAALVSSGNKSLHAWLKVDCRDGEEWEREVAGKLFPGYLVPLGMDPACSNPARLTRMPGFFRTDKMAVQRLLYLAPDGRPVCG